MGYYTADDPIKGFKSIIDENDLGMTFLSGQPIGNEHLNVEVWKVTDGHHRAVIAGEQGVEVWVTTDYNAIVDPSELGRW
jgi:hypothetical protein